MEISLAEIMQALTPTGRPIRSLHPYHGKRVLAVLPNGFIHFGLLHDDGERYRLTEAKNLRYWMKRSGGLPEFAADGPNIEDRIDTIGEVIFDSSLFFYQLGEW